VATPPSCTTCHQPASLPSLHKTQQHQTCTTCHSGHGPPRSDRATCLSCHQKQKAHQPAAQVCSGCHVFKR
jgi:hypothetical protein